MKMGYEPENHLCQKCGLLFAPQESKYWPNIKDGYCEGCVSKILQGIEDKPIPQALYRTAIGEQVRIITKKPDAVWRAEAILANRIPNPYGRE